MEIALFLALPTLALLFHWLAVKYNEHTIVLHAVSIAFCLIFAFLLFSEGLTETTAFTPAANQTITNTISNCTIATNATCDITSQTTNTYASTGQFTVIKKDLHTAGIALIFICIAIWFAVSETMYQLEHGFRL